MYLAQELSDAPGNLSAHSCLSVPLRSLSVCVWTGKPGWVGWWWPLAHGQVLPACPMSCLVAEGT